jgi:hypothetical protein
LNEVGETITFDWKAWVDVTSVKEMNKHLVNLALDYKPDLIFIEETWTGDIVPKTIKRIKDQLDVVIVNWNGDYTLGLLDSTLALGEVVDLTLMSNWDQVGELQREGIQADYLQQGCCPDVFRPVEPKPDKYPAEVIFLGSGGRTQWPNSDLREAMCWELHGVYGDNFRVYGRGWPKDTPFVYDFLEPAQLEAEAYSTCKVALGINAVTAQGYTSARAYKAMASGALYMPHCFPGCEELFRHYEHVVYWDDLLDLVPKVATFLSSDSEREKVARAGCEHAHENHSWGARARTLIEMLEGYGYL